MMTIHLALRCKRSLTCVFRPSAYGVRLRLTRYATLPSCAKYRAN